MQYDVNQILTWEAPVQKIISDRFVEELGTKEDAAFFAMVKTALGGAANTVVPFTGVVQWKEFSGGVTRKNVQRAKVITQGTPYFIEPSKAVVNVITMAEIYGWHRDEAGGNYSMDLMKGDHEALDIAGLKWIVTRKWQSSFVPNNTIYFFATPEYTGKFFMTQDAKTVVTNDHEPLVLFRAYETIGFVLGNVASVARADFVP
jgi:membrane protease subunit (stomatin/prohibitin family)